MTAPLILIIDDELGLLRFVQTVLEKTGYRTLIATSGAEGLELAYASHPNVIMMDEIMMDMNGSDLCYYIKNDATLRHIPVIIHSGGAKVYNPAHLKRVGADAGLPKPSSVDVILQTVQKCLEVRAS